MTQPAETVEGAAGNRIGWRPDELRSARAEYGFTLEEAGERLREVAARAGLAMPTADVRTLQQHEAGDMYPEPHYRRAYCLLYRAAEPALGFRNPLPGEEIQFAPAPRTPPGSEHEVSVERALRQIAAGGGDADASGLRQRIMDAWTHQHAGGDPSEPSLVLVAGYAGSGKTEFARFLSRLTGWPLIDKDPLTGPLVERLLAALGGDPHDRNTALYREQVRPLEYQCLLEAMYANADSGISAVVTAPFLAELGDSAWIDQLRSRCGARGVHVSVVWIRCDLDSMHEYIAFRAAARDAWKLGHWDEYAAGIDPELRPAVPHLVVDNRHGAAISLADQARRALWSMHE
ncbi:AAA family ATPase [Yinghuangia soli]|uniref:ATP-binding protein n=1 Tax=Yinghuangia soli TaxID=2908204 RepID=A0AA41TXE0_9ACTN|nr:AAA family ATPase [Yinghuangia soli]MCF2526738.1 ATP-binding protein [Yinghuangia soli]